MKRVLVTGANGYLGAGIVNELLKISDSYVIATDLKTDKLEDRYNLLKIDANIFELDNPYEFFECPDMILHLAWRDGFVHYSKAHIEDFPLHCKFIKKMAESPVDKIAVMGTMHEVGFFEGSINEKTPCFPQSFYGIAKNALRDFTKVVCSQNNKKYQWLRAYYIVGNSRYGSSVFSKIRQAEEKGNNFFPFTKGQNQFDFIDYDDFCNRVALTVIQNEILGIINICTGCPEKLSDRVERFIKDNGYNIRLEYGKFPDRPYDSKAIWGDSKKIEEIIKQYKMKY